MMRILMLSRDTQGLDPESGTASRWRLLRDAGVELEVVVASSQKAAWEERGLRVVGTGGASPAVRLWRLWNLAKPLSVGVDAVTAQDPFELGWIAWRIARRVAKRFEIQDHGGFFDGEQADEPLWWLRKRVAQFLSLRAHSIRTVSPQSEARLQGRDTAEKTYFLPITPREEFARIVRVPESDLLVTVSRLISVKRVDVLLRAFAEVVHVRPQARLVVIGDGPRRGDLEALRQELGLQTSVEFIGAQDPVPWLARASAFVSLSLHEGWGVASVEAALAGVPVVMTDTGCARWLEAHGKATVVTNTSSSSVARILEDALSEKTMSVQTPLTGVLTQHQTAIEQVNRWRELLDRKERVLICAQAMDEQDPLFGFFVPWMRAFAGQANVIVCALRVSNPTPVIGPGVEVIPLRPRDSRSRVAVIATLLRASWFERHRYTSVFVRGDAQYAALVGWLWRLLGKRVVFWYTHYAVRSPWFWLGAPWAHEVVTAVRDSNPLARALLLGHHIDTDFFTPEGRVDSAPGPLRVLVFGRISSVKRVDWIVRALAPLHREGKIVLRVIGTATQESAKQALLAALPSLDCLEERDVTQEEARELYRQNDVVVNATPGSMDKVILEASACGCVVLASTNGFREAVNAYPWLQIRDEAGLIDAVQRLATSDPGARRSTGLSLRTWVLKRHSQGEHVKTLAALLTERQPKAPFAQRIRTVLLAWFSRPPQGTSTFMFHAMDGRGVSGWDASRLRALVLRLRSHGYVFCDPRLMQQAGMFSAQAAQALFTFDDGTVDTREAIEDLIAQDISPILFIPSMARTISTKDGMERAVFSEDVINELAQSVRIGGHGVTHARLTKLAPERVVEELQQSYHFVRARHPSGPVWFAYPGGAYTSAIRGEVQRAGFDAAFTVKPGVCQASSDLFTLPRVPVLWWMSSRDAFTWINRTF